MPDIAQLDAERRARRRRHRCPARPPGRIRRRASSPCPPATTWRPGSAATATTGTGPASCRSRASRWTRPSARRRGWSKGWSRWSSSSNATAPRCRPRPAPPSPRGASRSTAGPAMTQATDLGQIANVPGASYRTRVNAGFQALASLHYGTSRAEPDLSADGLGRPVDRQDLAARRGQHRLGRDRRDRPAVRLDRRCRFQRRRLCHRRRQGDPARRRRLAAGC